MLHTNVNFSQVLHWTTNRIFLSIPEVFCDSKICQNAFPGGPPARSPLDELTMLLQTPSSAGDGTPLPDSTPLGAYGASILPFSALVTCTPPSKHGTLRCFGVGYTALGSNTAAVVWMS